MGSSGKKNPNRKASIEDKELGELRPTSKEKMMNSSAGMQSAMNSSAGFNNSSVQDSEEMISMNTGMV